MQRKGNPSPHHNVWRMSGHSSFQTAAARWCAAIGQRRTKPLEGLYSTTMFGAFRKTCHLQGDLRKVGGNAPVLGGRGKTSRDGGHLEEPRLLGGRASSCSLWLRGRAPLPFLVVFGTGSSQRIASALWLRLRDAQDRAGGDDLDLEARRLGFGFLGLGFGGWARWAKQACAQARPLYRTMAQSLRQLSVWKPAQKGSCIEQLVVD